MTLAAMAPHWQLGTLLQNTFLTFSLLHGAHSQVGCLVQGKLNTEALLEEKNVNWTSIRPVYIYGEGLHMLQ